MLLPGLVEDHNGEDKSDERPEYPWKKTKKMAALLSFSGKNYYGMQRNPGHEVDTIEERFLGALNKIGAIDPEWENAPQKGFFQRASRTDKGVSAAKMVVSLKMLHDENTIERTNEVLPPDIRLQGIVRVTKNFNCQSAAEARTYLYLCPTFAFSPVTEVVTEAWRVTPEIMGRVNEVLAMMEGVHYFHNFTSGKLPLEPSSQRFIMSFTAGEPFIKEGLEWSIIKVKGQSFMIHQIRKMIGLMVAIVRGHTNEKTIKDAWGDQRIDIPRAPGLGLLLDTIHYDKYNKRFADTHEGLAWSQQEEAVEKFKEEFIFSEIISTELREKSMLLWLSQALPIHTFTPRHFESEQGESQPLGKALRVIREAEAASEG